MANIIKLNDVIGGGYGDFWNFKGRYRVVKGSRASKKSRTTALWYIVNMMRYPSANLLVIRKTYNSLRNSCFSELKWAIKRLGVEGYWTVKYSPLEISYKSGGAIYFKGLDDSMKLTGITAEKGDLCWIWVEEAYEITREEDFDVVDETIRGKVENGLFKQTTLTFNPWSENHWLKARFFDKEDSQTFAATTDYTCNEWLDDLDKLLFEKMRLNNPKRFKVAGLGEWGVTDGLVYDNWEVSRYNVNEIRRGKNVKSAFGLDFGYTNDPTALCCMLVDDLQRRVYIFDELYGYGLSNRGIYEKICDKGYKKETIYADSAEPKSIDELYSLGLRGIRKARKGKDSVNHGIQFVREYRLVILPECVNFLKEVSAYSWEPGISGSMLNIPKKGDDHLMDAMRYGLSEINSGERWGF